MDHIKAWLASVGAIIALVAALFTVDSRYAHADEVAKDKQLTHQVVQQSVTQLRKLTLEDKVFELDVKSAQQKLSPVENALRIRYGRQLQELEQKK